MQAIKDALHRKHAYRRVFLADTDDARLIVRDLMRQIVPKSSLLVPGRPDITQANCGAHSYAAGILKLIHESDEDLHKQIAAMYQHENQQNQEQP